MLRGVRAHQAFATAGLLARYEGRFVFMFGPSNAHAGYGVVRLGGHREHQETALACATREAREEAGVEVAVSQPNTTYYMEAADSSPVAVASRRWGKFHPLLLSGGDSVSPHSVTFLGAIQSVPRPCGETQGIIMLTGAQIHRICSGPTTLGEIVADGARTIQRADMHDEGLLVPHLQLRFLDWALTHDALTER